MLHWLPKPLQRFSLRSLLVAMTVIGIIAGLVGIHFRNRAQVQSIERLIARANCSSFIDRDNEGLLQLDVALKATVRLNLKDISPEGFASLQQAANLIDPRRQQQVRLLFVHSGEGKTDLKRAKSIIASFAPRNVILENMPSDEVAFFLNRSSCRSLRFKTNWTSTVDLELNCQTLYFDGNGFGKFWQCVSPQSTVSEICFSTSASELHTFSPIPSLAKVKIKTQHVDECDVCQLMSRMHAKFVKLECCGLSSEEEARLEEAFAPNLLLEVQKCNCNP